MNALVLMAIPCPKSLHGKGEKWIARIILLCMLGLDSRQLMTHTIALAHTLTPSHTVRCLDRDTAGDCIGRAGLSGVWLRYPKHLGVHAGAGVCALTSSRRGPTGGMSIGNEYSIQKNVINDVDIVVFLV